MSSDDRNAWRGPSAASWIFGVVIGIGIGIALGTAMGNLGAGIAIGVAIGIAFALAFSEGERRRRRDEGHTDGGDQPPR